jgi:hypothetical protein
LRFVLIAAGFHYEPVMTVHTAVAPAVVTAGEGGPTAKMAVR